ncbi:BtrH N-terminal domain-containing protein [Geodermatophilus sabuli]|uniref:BtrH N-terminal domain-containing protein n=1 Tax=Geodermatophilus sabuli TaxID=1564158 RepID=A0A7K3W201_9ACTN|nr:BtrH N-terminal domain-containing protein [Geodermatophilus sabuli]NEK57937.1 BtrH N-terminal domain-containing protein [Geodermatophilus sabuli]
MTAHKHLKAAVRARMARTGERYTTARRNLSPADAGDHPVTGGGRHHDSGLLTNALRAAGVTAAHDGRPLAEPVVAGLAGGIGFMYFSFDYADALPTMTIVPRIHPRPFLAGALERAGVAHRVLQTGSAAKAARDLDAALDAGRTAICTVDRAGLGYQVWADSLEGAEPHEVGVLGRRDGVVLLDDECLAPTPVDAAAFAAARAAHRASRHRMLVVEPPAAPVDVVPGIRAALAVTVHDLTGDVMPNAFAGAFGLRGLAKWADAVADRRGRSGWARRFASGPSFGTAMRRLHDCLTTDLSSPGAMRPLYADFLDTAAGLLDEPALAEAAARYAAAGQLWAGIAEEAVSGPLAPYRALVERRLELLLDQGSAATDQLRQLAAEARRLTDGLELAEADRLAQLDRLAAQAAEVLAVEREACTTLQGVVGR